jgi:hypothetical protein
MYRFATLREESIFPLVVEFSVAGMAEEQVTLGVALHVEDALVASTSTASEPGRRNMGKFKFMPSVAVRAVSAKLFHQFFTQRFVSCISVNLRPLSFVGPAI